MFNTKAKRLKNYTREEKRQLKVKAYLMISFIVCFATILLIVFAPTKNNNVNANVEIDTPPVVEEIIQEEQEEEIKIDIDQVYAEMLAKVAWGEARGCTKTEQAAVMWCVLNRVDANRLEFGDTIATVITYPNQFHYNGTFPLEQDKLDLAYDVLTRWYTEKLTGEIDSGRVLPKEYCFFGGDGKHNWFRDAYRFEDANIWDWSWGSPYEE